MKVYTRTAKARKKQYNRFRGRVRKLKKSWCPTCQAFVEYKTEEHMTPVTFDGITARYNRKTAFCPVCCCVLNIPSVIDENVHARIEALYLEGRYE